MLGWIITGLLSAALIIMSLVLISGRGAFLIAGFNTMSANEKAKYDAGAMCKFIGKVLLPIGILTPFIMFKSISGWYPWVYFAVVTGLSIFAAVYANTGNRFKK